MELSLVIFIMYTALGKLPTLICMKFFDISFCICKLPCIS